MSDAAESGVLQLSMLVVDELHNTFPKLEKDIFFGEVQPDYLPYTKSSIGTLKEPFMGSTANLRCGNTLLASRSSLGSVYTRPIVYSVLQANFLRYSVHPCASVERLLR